MEKEFITYNQALALKELGFDEPCFGYYQKSAVIGDATILPIQIRNKASNFNDNEYSKMGVPFCSAPTYSQVFRWFREKYGLIGQPMSLCISYPGKVTHYGWSIVSNQNSIDWENEDNGFKIYEEAESKCLDKLIEICKTK